MYNKVILAGNLARDIEIRYTPGGSAVGKTSIATNRRYKSQTGEMKNEVMFIDLTLFGRTAEIANQYLRKGSKLLVDGALRFDQWTDQSGVKRSKHSVTVESMQMLDNKGGDNGNTQDYDQGGHHYDAPSETPSHSNINSRRDNASTAAFPEMDISEDEIPF